MLLSFSWAVTAACSYSRTERKHDTAQEQRASALSTSFGLVVLPRFVLEFWRASLSSREPTCNSDRKQPRGTLQLRTRYSLLPFRVQFPVSSLYVIVCLYATSSMQQGSHSFSHACQRPAPNTQQSWEEMELADGWVRRTWDIRQHTQQLAACIHLRQRANVMPKHDEYRTPHAEWCCTNCVSAFKTPCAIRVAALPSFSFFVSRFFVMMWCGQNEGCLLRGSVPPPTLSGTFSTVGDICTKLCKKEPLIVMSFEAHT